MDRRHVIGGFLGLSIALAACSGSNSGGVGSSGTSGQSTDPNDPTRGSTTVSSQTEQTNGGCPSTPERLTGKASTGSACTTFADCAPSCCNCSTSGSFLTAACVDRVCASRDVACGHSRKALCGDGSSSSSSSSSSSGSSGTSGSSGSSSSGSSGNHGQCVPGDSYNCQYTAKGSWTGSTCCVDTALLCVAGDSYNCEYTAKGSWTGSRCCVGSVSHCNAGDSYNCEYTAKGKWTGSLCCL